MANYDILEERRPDRGGFVFVLSVNVIEFVTQRTCWMASPLTVEISNG